MDDWRDKHYSFNQNTLCEHFPCHGGVEEENFNCLFCYCPLYALGKGCGGRFRYLENGFKDCSDCAFPHRRENYGAVLDRYRDIIKLMREADARRDAEKAEGK
jgi:Zn-finger protein